MRGLHRFFEMGEGGIMLALILSWALAGDVWATAAIQEIGGVAHSIWLDSMMYPETLEAANLLTLEKLGAGLIDDAEATQENLRNLWPEAQW